MRKQAIIPLAIGLIVGLVALKLTYDHMTKSESTDQTPAGPTQKIIVAASDISMGSKIDKSHLALVDMPEGLVPLKAVSDPEELIGQSARQQITAKMPVLADMVGPGEGIEGVIPNGYRAVSVKVDEFSAVAGLLQPGVKVDVVATMRVRDPESHQTSSISKLVLQNVEVRAVGQTFREENQDGVKSKLYRSVTLLVMPEQVERLELADRGGDIRLALRPRFDEEPVKTPGMTVCKLLSDPGTESAEANFFGNLFKQAAQKSETSDSNGSVDHTLAMMTPQAKPKPYVVEVIRGQSVERIAFVSRTSDQRVSTRVEAKPEAVVAAEISSDAEESD